MVSIYIVIISKQLNEVAFPKLTCFYDITMYNVIYSQIEPVIFIIQ